MSKTIKFKMTWSTAVWETAQVKRIGNYAGHESAFIGGGLFSCERVIPLEGPEQPYKWEWI